LQLLVQAGDDAVMAGGGAAVLAAQLVVGFSTYQRYRGFSEATVERRTWTITNLALHVDPRPLTVATADDVISFLSARPTAQTRYSLLCDIRQFYRWAIRQEHTEHDPTANIEKPKLPIRAPTPLTVAQIHRAILAAPTSSTMLAIMLAAFAGLRVSEIAAPHTDHLAHRSRSIPTASRQGLGSHACSCVRSTTDSTSTETRPGTRKSPRRPGAGAPDGGGEQESRAGQVGTGPMRMMSSLFGR
jgi:hypothetical protein